MIGSFFLSHDGKLALSVDEQHRFVSSVTLSFSSGTVGIQYTNKDDDILSIELAEEFINELDKNEIIVSIGHMDEKGQVYRTYDAELHIIH